METKCKNNSVAELLVTKEINYSFLLNADSRALKSKWKPKLDRESNRRTNLLISSWHDSISTSAIELLGASLWGTDALAAS